MSSTSTPCPLSHKNGDKLGPGLQNVAQKDAENFSAGLGKRTATSLNAILAKKGRSGETSYHVEGHTSESSAEDCESDPMDRVDGESPSDCSAGDPMDYEDNTTDNNSADNAGDNVYSNNGGGSANDSSSQSGSGEVLTLEFVYYNLLAQLESIREDVEVLRYGDGTFEKDLADFVAPYSKGYRKYVATMNGKETPCLVDEELLDIKRHIQKNGPLDRLQLIGSNFDDAAGGQDPSGGSKWGMGDLVDSLNSEECSKNKNPHAMMSTAVLPPVEILPASEPPQSSVDLK